jgi:hypothetical protein
VVYVMMGLGKLVASDVWWTGDAAWWLAAQPETRLVDLTWLPLYVLNAWTHLVVVSELSLGLLVWNRLLRPLLLALSTVCWISLALVTGLVPFCLLMLGLNSAFVPASVLRRWLRAEATPNAAEELSADKPAARVAAAAR